MKRYRPCPECGEAVLVEPTKIKTFTYNCVDCKVRVFVNGSRGIKRLRKNWETTHAQVV